MDANAHPSTSPLSKFAPSLFAPRSSSPEQPVMPLLPLDAILDDDDDFELTFSLDMQQRAAAESLARSRQALRSEEYRQLFHLPPEEVLIQDFNCALQKKILLQGHMYLFEHYICFYSNIFGYEKKKIIVLKDVTSVRKAKTAGLFPNAIEIVAWGKKSFFASFLSRDEAYRLIVDGWARHSRNAMFDSDSQSSLPVLAPNPQTTLEQQDISHSESSFGSRDIVEVSSENNVEGENVVANVADMSDEVVVMEGLPSVEDSSSSEDKDVNGTDSAVESSWEVEDEDAPKVPEIYKTLLECEMPVNVRDFFQMFFSNDSLKFFELFHQKCGDQEFHCTKWTKDQHFGGHVRDVSFRHPVKVYFGPKASNCQEVQRYRVYRDGHLVVETSQQMNDIPYGDYFHVEGRWDVAPLVGKVTSHCVVRVFVNVCFSKKTVWKGKIEQGTFDECKEVYGVWLGEAFRNLQQNGLIDSAPTKFENASRPFHAENSSGSLRAKSKMKHEGRNGKIQGQVKSSKSNEAASQEVTPVQTKQVRIPAVDTVRVSDSLQDAFMTRFGLNHQKKVAVIMCVLLSLLLVQMGIIIALSNFSRVQYVPINLPKRSVYYESLPRDYGRKDATWVEDFSMLLKEEINLAEARIENLQHNLNVLKVNLKLVEKSVHGTGSTEERDLRV